jgi:predicted 2-oxoglutarate/Fe(II)-dependent dioxygenase YbiX
MFIPAFPARNPAIALMRGEQVLSDSECDEIRRSVDWRASKEGKIGTSRPGAVTATVRSVLEQRLPVDPSNGFPLLRILAEICRLNSGLWYFDLVGFVPDDETMLLTYRGRDVSGDHYDWHIDVGQGQSASRKLGFSVQLSASDEYEGGDLEFLNLSSDREGFRRKGMLLVFPAFLVHRVTPVTKGTRHVIVGWVHGPSFR